MGKLRPYLARFYRHRIWRPLTRWLGPWYWPYRLFSQLTTPVDLTPNFVRRDSFILIEGAARSSNQYCVQSLRQALGSRDQHIAALMHFPGHVRQALRLRVPCVVLIREPAAAALSLSVHRYATHPRVALQDWVTFYRALRPYAARCLIVSFDECTGDIGAVFARINRRFGMTIPAYKKTPENEAVVKQRLTAINASFFGGDLLTDFLPNAPKKFARQKLSFVGCEQLLARAQALHKEYLALAAQQRLADETLDGTANLP